jgi:hypothetical protein
MFGGSPLVGEFSGKGKLLAEMGEDEEVKSIFGTGMVIY